MIQQSIFSDRHLQELTEYLPYPEGGGEEIVDFEAVAGIVEKAVSPYLNTLDDPAQVLVFVARAVYFLGALHGMHTYRYEVGGDKYFPEIEKINFSLDRYSAVDFIDFMREEVPPEFIAGICRKLGFDFEEEEDNE